MEGQQDLTKIMTVEQDGEINAVGNALPYTQEDWWCKRRATDRVLEEVGGVVTRVGDETVEVSDLASWLARQVKASDAVITHRALQTWSDKVGSSAARAAPARGTSKKSKQSKKTTRKKR